MKLTKGNKFSRNIKFNLDPNCKICKESIELYENYIKNVVQRKKRYGTSFSEGNREFIKPIVIRPDYNSAGYLTHWHIDTEFKPNDICMIKGHHDYSNSDVCSVCGKKKGGG